MTTSHEAPKKRQLPTVYTLLFIIIALMAALTWVLPAGKYNYLITHDPQPASRADMASAGLPRLHAPIQQTYS